MCSRTLQPQLKSGHKTVDEDVGLTITHQLHSDHPTTGHEVRQCFIERLPLMHCIELLCLPQGQLAHLHLTAVPRNAHGDASVGEAKGCTDSCAAEYCIRDILCKRSRMHKASGVTRPASLFKVDTF